jgi:hypothetical protein
MASILTFPRTLRSAADDKMPHIGFSLTGKNKPDATEIDRVHLFIPSGFSVKDGASFQGLELGTINAMKQVADTVKKGESVDSSDIFSGTDATVMGMKAIEGLTGGAGGTSAKAAMEQGVAFNPQTALAFDGVELRTFSFAFKLVPESKEEAEDARRIENFFRKYLYPEAVGSFSLKYPPKFKIQFFVGEEENTYMPMIHDCYLSGVQANFNPDGNSFYIDGQPTAIELSLEFSEAKQLTRNDLYIKSTGDSDPEYDYTRPGSFPNESSAGKSGGQG